MILIWNMYCGPGPVFFGLSREAGGSGYFNSGWHVLLPLIGSEPSQLLRRELSALRKEQTLR